MAQDQDRHGDAARAQLQRLVEAGHREIIRARLFQQPRRLQCAVAVGVGLHHAQKAAALGQRCAEDVIVVQQVFRAYLGPAAFVGDFHEDHSFPML